VRVCQMTGTRQTAGFRPLHGPVPLVSVLVALRDTTFWQTSAGVSVTLDFALGQRPVVRE
jgi:hypothetical protein